MIEILNVSHRFGDRLVLDNITLTLGEKRIGVVGGNGSGKSTFARLLNALVVPSQGRVLIDGLDTRREAKAIRRKVGFVFQDPDAQIVMPLVEEDIAFGLKNLKLPKPVIAGKVNEVLDRYRLTHLRHQHTHTLSGGEKQLLALSSVLVMQPEYIVLDEPTTLLDLRNKRMMQKVLAGLDQRAVVISHDLDMLDGFDRVLVMHEGRIVADGPPKAAVPAYVRMMDGLE
ncbi:MAG: ABC transporter ATP-binding protein [Rhodospirillales bacterium]|nr:MAG: ABC transporter ATP-binding protein [Rhodospirillales bacterium]